MKTVPRWRWWITSDTGKRHLTRWHMDEATAAAYPGAVREESTRQEIQVPEGPQEHDHTSAWQRGRERG